MSTRATRKAPDAEDNSPPKRQKVSASKRTEVKKKDESKVLPKLTIANTTPGEVFVCGSGECGQLGLGEDVDSAKKLKKLFFFDDKEIVQIAAGGIHNIVLTKDGVLYSWGCNDDKALGRSGEETEPGLVEGVEGIKFVQAVCGDSISAALTDDGFVYAWGTFRNKNGVYGFRPDVLLQATPFLIPELSRVTKIVCGFDHIVALTQDRRIFSFGCGECGQLGRRILGRYEMERSLIPQQLTFKPHHSLLTKEMAPTKKSESGIPYHSQFVDICSGGNQTFLIHETGTVFAVGLNGFGQLGVGDMEEVDGFTPFGVLVDNANKERDVDPVEFVSVSGSAHHSIALDRDGRVYTFGRNDDGQLGTGNTEAVDTPHLLAEPKDVMEVSANGKFTVAVVKDEKLAGDNLWAWGYGEMGQLANGGEDETDPVEVNLKGRHVFKAAAGGQHLLLLLRPKDE
ncbi:Regulator of chromosome condensation [Podochytrium sp. JEL0797]|nr:Regulator of chromosome condensation [Podochytrium sp. JEL0797]